MHEVSPGKLVPAGGIHQGVPFTPAMSAAVGREIEDLARWLALDLVLPH